MSITTINPATEAPIQTYALMSDDEIDHIINQCHQAYHDWKQTSFQTRGEVLNNISRILLNNKLKYATLIADEMGKPLSQGEAEIEKCAKLCLHYAENAEDYLKPKVIEAEYQSSYVCYKPLGIIFAIMPWNFPFWQVFRFLCPTLMTGNAALLRHADISTGTALAIEEIVHEAGVPQNAFRSLIIDNDQAAKVIAHDQVKGVTLTGSERAGKAVASHAGLHLKKVVLELGGSDPYVILDDADISLAAQSIVTSRLSNAGQICIACKRIIASKKTLDQLEEQILTLMQPYQMGEPTSADCRLGPMARRDLRDNVHKQVMQTVSQGAKLIAGGEIPQRTGFYYPPTLLKNVKPGMIAFDEEVFGPVFGLIEAKDEREAVELANLSPYGLAAAVFTQDLAKGERIARDELEAGSCFVNTFAQSNAKIPFGGIGLSGFGRELSEEGIKEFVNTKSVIISQ